MVMLRLFKQLTLVFFILLGIHTSLADSISNNPIVFVTMVPNPNDFGTLAATFGNHVPNPNTAIRGGDMWVRYPDGTLKNLTLSAGYGNTGFQGASSIAVRDPAVHWDGNKIIFSMVIGNPTSQYQLVNYKWQLYEMTGIGQSETPVITKIQNQPAEYNNIAPAYGSDDKIIFVSDRPRDNSVLHTYPQRDEYESSPVVSGLWKLNPNDGALEILDHAPSGDFNPIIDSFGRIIFTRWDHLQRDQQNIGASLGAYNFESETSTTATSSAQEIFPEARSNLDPDKKPNVNLFTINQFIPWAMNQDGTEVETINHIGRQEIGLYSERSFNDDPNVQEFYGQYSTGANQNEFTIFLHIKEDPNQPGSYFGTSCQEFGTHSGGQILKMYSPKGLNPDAMQVTYLTHPDTAGASDSPSGNHSGLYRDPLPLSNGNVIATHTGNTRQDTNIGTSSSPLSRYDYRLKLLNKAGAYFTPSTPLTSGITKSISFWNPDQMVSYSGQLWEMMAVEVKAKTRPQSSTLEIPSIEAGVITEMGVSIDELKSYLKSQNLALVVSRNLTSRDRNDRQQPTNLRILGTNTQNTPHSGKIYDISHLEFFQGDLIRGYGSSSSSGRRVLPQRMHSVEQGINPALSDAAQGAVKIASDGSMAAFVPARRALSWQTVDSNGSPVVRERYWVTFQPGEVRVCASCHGVNTADQSGNAPPTNPPLALAQLLAHWKNLPTPSPTITPTPTRTPNSEHNEYGLTISGKPKLVAGGKFEIKVSGAVGDSLNLKASIGNTECKIKKNFSLSGKEKTFRGKIPNVSKVKVKFDLLKSSRRKASKGFNIPRAKTLKERLNPQQACSKLMKGIR